MSTTIILDAQRAAHTRIGTHSRTNTLYSTSSSSSKSPSPRGSPTAHHCRSPLPIRSQTRSTSPSSASSSSSNTNYYYHEDSSFSSTSSSPSRSSTLDAAEIKHIFTAFQNATVSGTGARTKIKLCPSSPPAKDKKGDADSLVFGVRPWKQRAAAAAAKEQQAQQAFALNLNPTASEFVPGQGSARGRSGAAAAAPVVAAAPAPRPVMAPPQRGIKHYDFDESQYAGYCASQQQHYPPGLAPPQLDAAPQPEPAWAKYFTSGTSLAALYNPQMLELNATALVSSLAPHSWLEHLDSEQGPMAAFAGVFAGRVYAESREGGEVPVARFAAAVFEAFAALDYDKGEGEAKGEGDVLARAFVWRLSQAAVWAFVSAWSAEALDPSVHAPSALSAHVLSSIFLARYVGDLFALGLMPQDMIASCIAHLVGASHSSPFFSEEHVAALGHLVVQAGPELWLATTSGLEAGGMRLDKRQFEVFLGRMGDAVARVRCTLVEGNSQPRGYCAVWLENVRSGFQQWEGWYASAPVNGPSEAQ